MTDRDGIFAGSDPLAIAQRWLDEAGPLEPNDPNAMALATVDADGMPNVRVVLLKAIENGGFTFFTNYDSQKGTEIAQSGKAAFVLHWKSLRRQVRVRGPIARESAQVSDAYYASRALGSRIGAWASQQSRPLASRDVLMAEVEAARARLGESPARPPNWGGYKITPLEVEFWADGEFRLHNRFCWRRASPEGKWTTQRLYP